MPEQDSDLYRNRSKGVYDIKATRGYVVAPGSIHTSGRTYTIVDGSYPVEPPEWLLEVSKAEPAAAAKLRALRANRADNDDELDDLEEVDITTLKIDQSIHDRIVNGHAQGTDRSKADFGVIIALIKAGCSDAQIRWIFTEYPVGEKSDEHQDKYGYIQTSIDNAYEAVADEIEELAITDRQWSMVQLPDESELDVEFRSLAEYACRDLRAMLEGYGNVITPQRLDELRKLVISYSAMANGKLYGRIAFPLPTGYGKTLSIIAFLSRAVRMQMLGFIERYGQFSIAITAFKVGELCSLYRALLDAGVPKYLISLCHSYKHSEECIDSDGNVTKDGYAAEPATYVIDPETGKPKLDENKKPIVDTSRPILLLTHNKTKVAGGHDFNSLISDRTMLIWDEAMLSTEAGVVNVMKIDAAVNNLETKAKAMQFLIKESCSLKDLLDVETVKKTAAYLRECVDSVWEEIGRQSDGLPKQVLPFDAEAELSHGEMLEVLSDLIKAEKDDHMAECFSELRTFTRITMHDASVELNRTDDNHMVIRFEIVMPDSVENIIILDASTWINAMMKLDKTISIPEGINPVLSYAATTIHRIDFNSGREPVTKELQSNEGGLLDAIDEIVRCHPEESILFFTFKEREGVNSQALIEEYLVAKGHNIHASCGQHMRFNWMTHGNYTASNRYSHCTVMVFVGMLHKPQYVYRAQAIAQTRDLTTTITKADESRIKEAGHATDAHQGINRGAGRVIQGNTTQPVNAYYTYLSDNLVEDLQTVMPDVEHRLYETETLRPKTQLEACIRATKKHLAALRDNTMKVSKASINKLIPEMADANKRMRDRVSISLDADPTIPWESDNRSWVRASGAIATS